MAVLIVHDREIIYSPQRKTLQEAGYPVYETFSGEEALSLLEDHQDIDITLIDASLPGTGAFPLAAYIRLTSKPDMAIVLIAAFSLPVMYLALKNGCNELIAKPCTGTTLISVVRHLTNM